MRKKKGIRYSELTAAAIAPPVVPPDAVPLAPIDAPPAVSPAASPDTPPPRVVRPRVSTPIEMARALATEALELPEAPARLPRRVVPKIATVDLLVFRVGDERFAVELLGVDEVIDLPAIHHVPEMPPAMLGVVSVRGMLTPVYSPQAALGVPLANREAVLIFRRGRMRVGVLIDDVDDAISVDLRELSNLQGTGDSGGPVRGVMRHAGVLVAIVDADALIAACQTAALLEIA